MTARAGEEQRRFVALPARERRRRQRLLLAAYERTRGIKAAAALSGVHTQRHYDWLREDAKYRAAFARAKLAVAAAAERAVLRGAGAPRWTEAQLMEVVRRLRRPGYGAGPRWPGKLGDRR